MVEAVPFRPGGVRGPSAPAEGYTRLGHGLLEALARYPFSKRQLKVLLAVLRKTAGYGKAEDDLASSQLAVLTGLTAAHCREAVLELARLGVLRTRPGRFGKVIGIESDWTSWGQSASAPEWDTACPAPGRAGAAGYGEGRPGAERPPSPPRDGPAPRAGTHTKTIPIDPFPPRPRTADACAPPRSVGGGGGEGEEREGGGRPGDGPDVASGRPPLPVTTRAPVDLVFPRELGERERREAATLVAPAGADAQALLDVLAAAIRAGQVRKSALAVLAGLVRRWQAGTFDPTPGVALAESRRREQARQAAERAREREWPAQLSRLSPEAARERIAQLRRAARA